MPECSPPGGPGFPLAFRSSMAAPAFRLVFILPFPKVKRTMPVGKTENDRRIADGRTGNGKR